MPGASLPSRDTLKDVKDSSCAPWDFILTIPEKPMVTFICWNSSWLWWCLMESSSDLLITSLSISRSMKGQSPGVCSFFMNARTLRGKDVGKNFMQIISFRSSSGLGRREPGSCCSKRSWKYFISREWNKARTINQSSSSSALSQHLYSHHKKNVKSPDQSLSTSIARSSRLRADPGGDEVAVISKKFS